MESPDGSIGTEIGLESDLNLADRDTLPAFFAGVRVGDRFAITGEYFELNRDGVAGVSRDIEFDNVTFPVGASVTSRFDTTVYRANLAYSFVRNERLEFGGSIGAHVTELDVELSGEGFVGSASVQSQVRRRDILAPLPTVGLFGSYQASPRITLAGRADYMSLGVGDYDGSVFNTQLSASYRIYRNIGIGLAYRYVDYDVEIDKDTWRGGAAYTFSGPSVFLRAAF